MRSEPAKVEGGGWLKAVGGGVAVPQTMQNDPWRWEKGETSVDRWERSVNSCEAEQNILGDKLKNSMKSCGQRTQCSGS